jgi:hypothetical protein
MSKRHCLCGLVPRTEQPYTAQDVIELPALPIEFWEYFVGRMAALDRMMAVDLFECWRGQGHITVVDLRRMFVDIVVEPAGVRWTEIPWS